MRTSDALENNILSTYFTLRMGIVVLSFALPVVLYLGGWHAGLALAGSMSAYYGEGGGVMRDWFVGILWAVGSFLVLYKGFSRVENVALNLAGGFAVLVALVPCNCWTTRVGTTNRLHIFCAVAFFLSMAFVCLFCAGDTITLLPEEDRAKFRLRYKTIGGLMVLSPAAAILVSYLLQQPGSYQFFIEAFGVLAFGVYWIVKSREFRITSAETRAAHGQLANIRGKGVVEVAPQAPPVH